MGVPRTLSWVSVGPYDGCLLDPLMVYTAVNASGNGNGVVQVVPGELTIITGVPNSGKSEWIDALVVNLADKFGWRFGLCSMEKKVSCLQPCCHLPCMPAANLFCCCETAAVGLSCHLGIRRQGAFACSFR